MKDYLIHVVGRWIYRIYPLFISFINRHKLILQYRVILWIPRLRPKFIQILKLRPFLVSKISRYEWGVRFFRNNSKNILFVCIYRPVFRTVSRTGGIHPMWTRKSHSNSLRFVHRIMSGPWRVMLRRPQTMLSGRVTDTDAVVCSLTAACLGSRAVVSTSIWRYPSTVSTRAAWIIYSDNYNYKCA